MICFIFSNKNVIKNWSLSDFLFFDFSGYTKQFKISDLRYFKADVDVINNKDLYSILIPNIANINLIKLKIVKEYNLKNLANIL